MSSYEASGFEKQRKYVSKQEFDAAVEAEYKQLRKKNAKATMAQAQKKVEARGLEPDFLGEELFHESAVRRVLGSRIVASAFCE